MKKYLLIILILSLLSFCKYLEPQINYDNNSLIFNTKEIKYIKDNRTNLCFAYIVQKSCSGYRNVYFTEVPCRSTVVLIEDNQ